MHLLGLQLPLLTHSWPQGFIQTLSFVALPQCSNPLFLILWCFDPRDVLGIKLFGIFPI